MVLRSAISTVAKRVALVTAAQVCIIRPMSLQWS